MILSIVLIASYLCLISHQYSEQLVYFNINVVFFFL